MIIIEKLNKILENPERMGSFAIQTDHPGLMKSIKKKKISKVDRSPFIKDKDAKKQHIVGVMDNSGKKKSKIECKINKKLETI